MAPLADEGGPGRPLSVKEISARAEDFEWNVNIPFKHWLRTSQLIQQQADMYLREYNFPQAYLLYLRYSTLVVDLLKTHPEAKTPEAKKALQNKFLTIDVVFKRLEMIKPILEQQYEDWTESQAKKKKKPNHDRQSSTEVSSELSAYQQHASKDPALSNASRLLDAGEHQDFAVELAQREIQRRDADRRATQKNGETRREQQQRRTAGIWDTWTQDIADKQAEDEEVFRKQMESTRRTLDQDTDSPPSDLKHATDRPLKPPSMPSYSYPKIARSVPIDYIPQPLRSDENTPSQPTLPPKQEVVDHSPLAPKRPAKTPYPREFPHELPSRPPKLHDSVPEPQKKQQGVAFKPAAYLENGEPIRPVFLPGQLRRRFLEIASENTKRGLEMCGILCGTAVNNALFIRCLLIPEQKCTSDTCETENEATILDYCIEEDLLMLGWIHTHPTQTCFMSSRDLHTQSGYQVMLPESIAIVCAPKFEPSYGIFRLTNPPGLPHILGCTQSSTFHAHSVDNLYTGAEHPPGHVYEHNNLDFYVQDIRPGARNGAVSNKNC
ncbi:Mov34/MPN/PAD-1 family protein [Xylaria flabelliformis]|nr:Mov34/MPN/PAD-1 family protein [Xylaria flabelliformis]